MKKFNQARVNGGSNYDSNLLRVMKAARKCMLVHKRFTSWQMGCTVGATYYVVFWFVFVWPLFALCLELYYLVGNTVKLRGPPKAFITKLSSKDDSGRANSPGYSNSMKDVTMGNPQPSPKDLVMGSMDAVQRLDGSGCYIRACNA